MSSITRRPLAATRHVVEQKEAGKILDPGEIARFLQRVSGKNRDFHAPTRRGKGP